MDDHADAFVAYLRSTGETGEMWRWRQLIANLDRAGFMIVPKPTLLEVGVPVPFNYVPENNEGDSA